MRAKPYFCFSFVFLFESIFWVIEISSSRKILVLMNHGRWTWDDAQDNELYIVGFELIHNLIEPLRADGAFTIGDQDNFSPVF